MGLLSLVSWPTFVLMAWHADAVVQLVYGHQWAGAGPLFAAFCVCLPFYVMLAITGPLLWAMDGVQKELKVQVVAALLTLLGLVVLSNLAAEPGRVADPCHVLLSHGLGVHRGGCQACIALGRKPFAASRGVLS